MEVENEGGPRPAEEEGDHSVVPGTVPEQDDPSESALDSQGNIQQFVLVQEGTENKVSTFEGPMKGGLSVRRRPEMLRNVRRQLGNETVSVGLKWSVKCRVTNSECRCRATLILG